MQEEGCPSRTVSSQSSGRAGADGVNTLNGTCKFINYTGIRIAPNVESPAFLREFYPSGIDLVVVILQEFDSCGIDLAMAFLLEFDSSGIDLAMAIINEFDSSGPNLMLAL